MEVPYSETSLPPYFLISAVRLGSLSPSEQVRHSLSPSPSSCSTSSCRKESRPAHRSRSIARHSDLHREAATSSSSSSSNSQYDVLNGGVDAMKSTFTHLKSLAREMNTGAVGASSLPPTGAAAAAAIGASRSPSLKVGFYRFFIDLLGGILFIILKNDFPYAITVVPRLNGNAYKGGPLIQTKTLSIKLIKLN